MKKRHITLFAAASLLLLSACGKQPSASSAPVSSAPASSAVETTVPTETPVSTEAPTPEPEPALPSEEEMTETIKSLLDTHLDCMRFVMELGNYPTVEYETMPEDGLVQVDPEYCPDYAAFEEYIRGIYSTELADRLLYNFPYEGNPKYVNVDGDLYLNMMLCGGKGYYVDWDDYSVEITELTENSCKFIAHTTVTWPAEKPVPEPYDVEGELVMEENGWRMNSDIY